MSRILLIHWNKEEAKERAARLAKLKHKTDILFDSEKRDLKKTRESPPDLFLIDLSRLPSQGREIAGYLRRLKSTRNVPVLFVGGDTERVASARKLIPDAQFTEWPDIKVAIPSAIRNAPATPVVPGTMAGYSGSPLPKKLGIREGHSVVLVNSPERFERKLGRSRLAFKSPRTQAPRMSQCSSLNPKPNLFETSGVFRRPFLKKPHSGSSGQSRRRE
jgi:hypothetical protein